MGLCSRSPFLKGAEAVLVRSYVQVSVCLLIWTFPLAAQDFTVQTNIPAQGFLSSEEPIELTFSRTLDLQNESVAVFIGATDFTGLFRPIDSGPRLMPQVLELGILGFQSREVTSKPDVAFKSQPWEEKEPDVEQVHAGFALGPNSLFLGFNNQENALRFREKGEDASKVDLSSYDLKYGSEKLTCRWGTSLQAISATSSADPALEEPPPH